MKTLKAVSKAHIKIFTTLILTFAVLLTACNINDNKGTGTLRVSLTDAPGDFLEVNVEIHQVLVKMSTETGDDQDLNETIGMDEAEIKNSGWEIIFNDTLIINLLDYQNGATLPLGEVDLEPGRYEQIRLLLGNDNSVTLTSGQNFPLITPSGQTSGYKLNLNADIEEGQLYDLVIDFDASRSVVARGNGSFSLKPVLRTVELDNTGSISGVVRPIEAAPYIFTIVEGDTIGTSADSDGNFKILGLYNGSYDLIFNVDDDVYIDTTLTAIELGSNEELVLPDTVFIQANVPE